MSNTKLNDLIYFVQVFDNTEELKSYTITILSFRIHYPFETYSQFKSKLEDGFVSLIGLD